MSWTVFVYLTIFWELVSANFSQGGRGHWIVNNTCTKVLKTSYLLVYKFVLNFNLLVQTSSFQTFKIIICFFNSGNFVYHHWVIFIPSYPFRSLILPHFLIPPPFKVNNVIYNQNLMLISTTNKKKNERDKKGF